MNVVEKKKNNVELLVFPSGHNSAMSVDCFLGKQFNALVQIIKII